METKPKEVISNEVTYNLTIRTDRNDRTKNATIRIRPVGEAEWNIITPIVKAGREMDATRQLLKMLYVDGDPIEPILANFEAVRSAGISLLQLIEPLESELKKN